MPTDKEKANAHKGHRNRLKKRFLAEGIDSFNEHQILELLLFFTLPQKDTNLIAHDLISTFGSLSRVFEAHPKELEKIEGIGQHSSSLITLIPQLSRAYLKDLTRERPVLDSARAAGEYVKNFFMGRIYEVFYIFCMDKSCRVIHEEKICEGTLDETPCYPRLVLEAAFRHNAQRVIFAHNHPSGLLKPSPGDIASTHKLVQIFESVDIEVVDHIIAGKSGYISMAELSCLR